MQYYFFLAEEWQAKKKFLRFFNLNFEFKEGDLISQKLLEPYPKEKTETCFFCKILKISQDNAAVDVILEKTGNIVGKKYRHQTIRLTIPGSQPVIVLRKIRRFDPKTRTRKNCRHFCHTR
jgi:hypothetical protein